MPITTALWTPEIVPPSEWLIPAVLYQDRISTLSPWPLTDDIDGRKARHLQEALGPDLYSPLSLDMMVHRNAQGLIEVLEGQIPLWWLQLSKADPDPWARRWLDSFTATGARARIAADRAGRAPRIEFARRSLRWFEREVQSAERALDEARELSRRRIWRLAQFRQPLLRLEECLQSVQPGSFEEEILLEEKANLTNRVEELLADMEREGAEGCRWSVPPELAPTKDRLVKARQSHQSAAARVDEAREALEATRQESMEYFPPGRRLRTASSPRLPVQISNWNDLERNFPGLGTIAAGKIESSVVDFLIARAGLWFYFDDDRHRGTLVGPKFITRRVLETVGEWFALTNEHWVSMSSGQSRQAETTAESVSCMALQATLPLPSTSLEGAVQFRIRHEQELAELRKHLAASLSPELDAVEYRNQLQALIAEPLAEIELASRLAPGKGLRRVRVSVLHALTDHAHQTAVGIGAAVVAAPVLGNTIGIDGIVAETFGMALLFAGSTVYKAAQAQSSHRKLASSPFKYLYEMHRVL